jgi:hypothetical protein
LVNPFLLSIESFEWYHSRVSLVERLHPTVIASVIYWPRLH